MITINENYKGLKSYSGLANGKSSPGRKQKTKGKAGTLLSEFYRKHTSDDACTVIGGFSEMRSEFADEADRYLEW